MELLRKEYNLSNDNDVLIVFIKNEATINYHQVRKKKFVIFNIDNNEIFYSTDLDTYKYTELTSENLQHRYETHIQPIDETEIKPLSLLKKIKLWVKNLFR